MAEILLFHHAQGLTSGVVAWADELRAAGHVVHTPDLYDGRTFATVQEGVAHAEEVGFGNVVERGVRAANGLPAELVYAGFSLGVMAAQQLAQTRPGARGAILCEACVPTDAFGDGWPAGVPVQVHGMDADEFFGLEATRRRTRADGVGRRRRACSPTPATPHPFTDSLPPTTRQPRPRGRRWGCSAGSDPVATGVASSSSCATLSCTDGGTLLPVRPPEERPP
jgi:dienelactone hydrolase